MSLSDCSKCWDTPCTCGYYYVDASWLWIIKRLDLYGLISKIKWKLKE